MIKILIFLYIILTSVSSFCASFPDIPINFIIGKLNETLTEQDSKRSSVHAGDISSDRSFDDVDYLRILNMISLLQRKNATPELLKKQWLISFSHQVDALNINDGSLRDLLIQNKKEKMIWRRLSYLHHGLCLSGISKHVHDYIIAHIWESNEWNHIGNIIEGLINSNLLTIRKNMFNKKNTWGQLALKISTINLNAPLPWFALSDYITLQERMLNFGQFLEKKESDEDTQSTNSNDDAEYTLMPYARMDTSFRRVVETFADRGDAIAKKYYENEESRYPSIDSTEVKTKIVSFAETLDNYYERSIKEFNGCFDSIRFDDLNFYIGMLSEYEHLKIAHQTLRNVDYNNKDHRVIFDSIAIAAESLNNTFLPLADVDRFTDIVDLFTFLRNKGIEHSNNLQKYKMFVIQKIRNRRIDLYEDVMNALLLDLKQVNNLIEFRLDDLYMVMKAEEDGSHRIEQLKHKFLTKKRSKPAKQKRYFPKDQKGNPLPGKTQADLRTENQWKNLSLPGLEGLWRFFYHRDYSFDKILRPNNYVLSNYVYRKEKKYDEQKFIDDQQETSTLKEFNQKVSALSAFLSQENIQRDGLEPYIKTNLMARMRFFRCINDIKESFCYIAEHFGEDYIKIIEEINKLKKVDSRVFWYFYADLRDRRNLATHDLWRDDLRGMVNIALRIKKLFIPIESSDVQKEFEAHVLNEDFRDASTLLEYYTDIDVNCIINLNGDTPLHIALRSNQYNFARLLLNKGANTDFKNADGEDAYTVIHDELEKREIYHTHPNLPLSDEPKVDTFMMAQFLKERDAFSRGQDADALHKLIRVHSYRTIPLRSIEALIQQGVPIDLYDEFGDIPFNIALSEKYKTTESHEILKILLSSVVYFDINKTNLFDVQEAPLHLAAQRHDVNIAKLLLDNRADVNYPNSNNSMALHFAVAFRNLSMAQLFVERGANVNALDGDGASAVMLTLPNYIEHCQYLLEQGADSNLTNDNQTMLEEIEEHFDRPDGITSKDIVYFIRFRDLLLAHNAHPIFRMTPFIYDWISKNITFPVGDDTYRNNTRKRSDAFSASIRANSRDVFNYNRLLHIVGTAQHQRQIALDIKNKIDASNLSQYRKSRLLQCVPGYVRTPSVYQSYLNGQKVIFSDHDIIRNDQCIFSIFDCSEEYAIAQLFINKNDINVRKFIAFDMYYSFVKGQYGFFTKDIKRNLEKVGGLIADAHQTIDFLKDIVFQILPNINKELEDHALINHLMKKENEQIVKKTQTRNLINFMRERIVFLDNIQQKLVEIFLREDVYNYFVYNYTLNSLLHINNSVGITNALAYINNTDINLWASPPTDIPSTPEKDDIKLIYQLQMPSPIKVINFIDVENMELWSKYQRIIYGSHSTILTFLRKTNKFHTIELCRMQYYDQHVE